jgi:pimeloyl-ACP methyl ester carboxylesterase
MTSNVTGDAASNVTGDAMSTDGTRIAFDRLGGGPGDPVVVVGGLLCDRERTGELAGRLAERLAGRGGAVVAYDRRGRGASTDTRPTPSTARSTTSRR